MTLAKYINKSTLWRPLNFPVFSFRIAIVCYHDDIEFVESLLGGRVSRSKVCIFVINQLPETPRSVQVNGKYLKVENASKLVDSVNWEIVYFSHTYDYGRLVAGSRLVRGLGFESFYVCMPIPYNKGLTTLHLPDYYDENREQLEMAFGLLDDEESRLVFAARVRAIVTGNIGFVRVSSFDEYYHPLVSPQSGDVIIDGGVSGDIESELRFCESIGEKGYLFGFEPDPIGLARATEKVSQLQISNFTILPFGLWQRAATLNFTSAGLGSHIATDGEELVIPCQMMSIDDFVKEYNIKKVDFIKLDVEGAEPQVLRGGVKSIVKFRPRMAISIYHAPEDLYVIPLLVKQILPACRFYLGHHHCSLHETILYILPN